MKNIITKLLSVLFFLSFLSNAVYPANYAWTGSTSVNWSTSANWNPNGVPSSSDTVTISNQTNNPKLNANTTVKKLTMTSGTLDLNTYKLTISNYGYFNGGAINNGTVYQSAFSNSSINFSGTTFGAKVSISGTVVSMISTTFSDSVTITQSGSPLSAKGGNTFNGPVYFSSSLSSSIVLSDSLPDTFNSTLEINNTGTGAFYIAHRGTGNQFNGNVKFTGQNIYSNYYGTATYSENINIYSFSSKGKKWSSVYFGYSTGSCTLANGKTIAIDTTVTRGAYYFQNFTQQGSGSMSFYAGDSVHFYFNPGTTFNASVNCTAPYIHLDGSKFNSTANFTNNANMNLTSLGGCFFGSTTSITNNTAGSYTYTIGSTLPDTFQTSATIQNNTGIVSINNAVFNGTAYLNNYDSSTTSNRFFVNNTGQTIFHGPLVIDNVKSGMFFGGQYPLVMDCIDCFDMNDVSSGSVTYKNATIASDVTIVSQLANGKLVLDSGNTFNGKFTFIGHDIEVKGSVFNDTVKITKTGSSDNGWYGANVFNAHTTITDSSTSGHWLSMALAASDTFNADVVFQQKGAGIIYPAYSFPYYVSGNLSVGGTSAITFGTNAGIVFTGSNNQTISKLSSFNPAFKKLIINKPGGSLTLNSPINIIDTIKFQKGIINTDTTYIITLLNGGKSLGATDSSFVNGPFKKVGSQAFIFPIGKNTSYGYRPAEMTAPFSTTDAYTAQYINSGQTFGGALDTSIEHLNTCEYWKLDRNNGSSKVRLKINWNHSSCELIKPEYMRIAGWDGSKWKDFRSYTYDGDSNTVGSVTTLDSTSTICIFTTAYKRCIYFKDVISKRDVNCHDGADGIASVSVSGGTTPYTILWSKNVGTDFATAAILYPGQYNVEISDALDCQLTDSVVIINPDELIVEFSTTPSLCGDSSGVATINASGGTGIVKKYYWFNDGSESQTHENLAAGEYTVLVTDSNGCVVFGTVQVPDSDGPEITLVSTATVWCIGDETGGALISIDSGVEPYNINWSSSINDTLEEINDVGSGYYSVKVTDSIGCITFDTIEISQTDTFKVTINTENTHCGAHEGSAEAIVEGGTSPFDYEWSNSSSTEYLIESLNSGIDTLIVTDAHGCQIQKVFEILDIGGIILNASLITNPTCFMDSTGSARVSVTGGTGPYTYSWFPKGGENDTAINLIQDIYQITVIDSNGCRQKTEIEMQGPNKLYSEIIKALPSLDTLSDGVVNAIAYGGIAPYEYEWKSGSNLAVVGGRSFDPDTLTVTDSRGCISQAVTKSYMGPWPPRPITRFCNYQNSPQTCFNTLTCTGCTLSVTKEITDFGANGSDNISDECAFEKAAEFFSNLGHSVTKVLHIEAGTYFIGRQEHIVVPAGFPNYLTGHNVLSFSHVENLTIIGDVDGNGNPSTILRTNPCMLYGTFDPVTGERWIGYPWGGTDITCEIYKVDWRRTHQVATIGDMIVLNYCNNITLKNLELDGNISKTIIGGGYTEGMQLGGYAGITMNAARNCKIENIYCHHFGYDGLTIRDSWCLPDPRSDINATAIKLIINNSTFSYNARNNMTWAGGYGVTAFNSYFTHAGQSRYVSPPGAGLDIEWEPAFGGYSLSNSHGNFRRCHFEYNHTVGMISLWDTYLTRDYTFDECTFVGDYEAMHNRARQMRFINKCYFAGKVINWYDAPIANRGQTNINRTIFHSCYFNEEHLVPGVGLRTFQQTVDELTSCTVPVHQFMLDFNGSRIQMTNCVIETNYTLKCGIFIGGGNTFNLFRMENVKLFNYGLNGCACDKNVSSMSGMEFIGTNNFQRIAINGTLRNGAGCVWPQYHGWVNNFFAGTFDIWNCCAGYRSLQTKYVHPVDPNPVNDLFVTSIPPCYYKTTSGIQAFCNEEEERIAKEKNVEKSFNINIYPNPTNNILYISGIEDISYIVIADLMGKEVFSYFNKENSLQVDLSKFSPGIYIIKLNETIFKKIIKQ